MISFIVWDIRPNIFHDFEYLRWYGIFWVLGIMLAYIILLKIYKSEDVSPAELDKLFTFLMVGIIFGARFGHILFYDPMHYWNNPIEILPIRVNPTFEFTGLAGLASHGGMIGALFALYLYCRKFRKDYLWLLDRLTIGGAALGGFIRLGNLMNSEIIGIPTNLPWAFIFTEIDQTPRHPAQLYEAISYLTISVVLYLIWNSGRRNKKKGFVFGLGIVLIFTQRFLVEFLKENQVSFEESLTLNMGQILSIPLVLVGVGLMFWSLRSSVTNYNCKEQA